MTTDHRDDTAAFRALLIEDAKRRAGPHPDLDTLVDYATDRLDEEQDERVRDHLAACRDCGTLVLDLEPLANPDAPTEGVADLELEVAWKDLRSRMEASTRAGRPAPAARWPMALAASLLVAVVGLSTWVVQLQEQVADFSRPQANLPVFYVDELTRSSGSDVAEVSVPSGASYFVLIFASAELGAHESYALAFVDAAGREVLRSSGLQLSESGGLRIGLPRDLLPAGDYLIRLSAIDGDRERALEEYRRRIDYP